MLFSVFHSQPPRSTLLSRPEKPHDPIDLRRRNFLLQSSRGASAAVVTAALRRFHFHEQAAGPSPSPGPDHLFYLRPHYRVQTPLDALLLKTTPGSDEFSNEIHAEKITALLREWGASLCQPGKGQHASLPLAPDFQGASLRPTATQTIRSGPIVETAQCQFGPNPTLSPAEFQRELQSELGKLSLATADFFVTRIDATSGTAADTRIKTTVRYEFAGSAAAMHKQQRIGTWTMEWVLTSAGGYQIRRWSSETEHRAQSRAPVFSEITAAAFAGNSSYPAQLCRGTDYWRSVLDAASGIDIYGHNGISFGDIDGDGLDDIYICQPAGLPNLLFRNRGDGTFEDITQSAGVGVLENTACALIVDVDNDGRQDLIVVRTDGPMLFLNQGNGKFKQKPNAFHFANPPQGTFTGAAVADYDRDGWLDIYFCLYVYYQGTDQYKYPSPYYAAENGPPNFLFRNNRDGTFRDVTAASGLNKNNTRYSFCCGWNDFNADGWPDLYVVNDFGKKNLYRNNGDGTFTDVAAEAAVLDIGAGMSVAWGDYDNDGKPDLYVADMWTAAGERVSMQEAFQTEIPSDIRDLYRKHARGNSLFHNKGNGAFDDTSAKAGVEMGRWSWSCDLWDFDHDGYQDLYIANGMVSGPDRFDLNSFFWRHVVARSPNEARPSHDYEQGWTALNELLRSDFSWSGYERNVLYANNRDGTFSDVSACADLDFLEDGRSFALADLDQDGRLELLVKSRNAPTVRLLKNVVADLSPSITFRLTGKKSNRDAIGASVTLETSAGKQIRFVQAGSGFLSQHTKDLHFGLGAANSPIRATVQWPSGLKQVFENVPANHRVRIDEGSDQFQSEPFRKFAPAEASPKPSALSLDNPPDPIETWLLEPVDAPDFTLADASGRKWSLRDSRGKLTFLSLLSQDSPSWNRDIRALADLQPIGARNNLSLLAINFAVSSTGTKLASSSFPTLQGSDDVAGVYNVLYRYLFDRHRDLTLPTSFLLNDRGEIVKIIQGRIDPLQVEKDLHRIPRTLPGRIALALPFSGLTDATEFPRNYLSFGSAFFQRGFYDQAEGSFQRAARDNPTSAEAQYGLGSVYLKQNKKTEARASFEAATRLEASYPDTLPDAWNNLGLLAAQDGRAAEAVQYFEKALEISPDHIAALDNLGNAFRQLKRWDDARTILERAVHIAPQDPEANYSLGMVFAQQDDTERAYQYLQKALALRPAYPEALNNLGILYLRTQRRDQAVATFEECIRIAPGFDQAYMNLARVYAIEGTPEKAKAVLQELLKQHPDHPQAKAALDQLSR